MIRVKTFRFVGSKNKYVKSTQEHEMIKDTESNIDMVINDFITDDGYKLVSVSITPIDCQSHNNCGYNKVDLLSVVIVSAIVYLIREDVLSPGTKIKHFSGWTSISVI